MAEGEQEPKRRPLRMWDRITCGGCFYFDSFEPRSESPRAPGQCRKRLPDSGSHEQFPHVSAACRGCGEYIPADPKDIDEGAAALARSVLAGDMTAARALADKLLGGD
jgi:hypothetical protein